MTWPSVAVKRLFSLILLTKFLCFSHSIRKKDAFLYFIESVFFVCRCLFLESICTPIYSGSTVFGTVAMLFVQSCLDFIYAAVFF